MPRFVYTAFVLKSSYVFEIDREVILFTKERGKLTALGRGGAKVPNRFGSALEPFTKVEATVWESWKGGLTLEILEILRPGYPLMADPSLYPYLSVIQEVLLLLLPENLPREKLFHLLDAALEVFSRAPLAVSCYLLFWILKMEGFPVERGLPLREFFRLPLSRFIRKKIPLSLFINLGERAQNFLEQKLQAFLQFKILLKIGQ